MSRDTQTSGRRHPPRRRPRATTGVAEPEKLVAKMVYLSAAEVADLELEAMEGGRSGISQQIRHALAQRRRLLDGSTAIEITATSGTTSTAYVQQIVEGVRRALL